MRLGLGTLTRIAMLSGLVLASACSENPVTPPAENPAPTGLAAAATGTTTINVTWTAPATTVTL